MGKSISDGLTDAVRRFQWFYTCHVRAPHELAEHSALSLTELRVLFAVMHAGTCTAADISRTLGLDTGYLSRMLTQFERSGLIARDRFAGDARSNRVSLTTAGATGLAATSAHVRDDVSTTLAAMTPDEGTQLIASMGLVERLLSPPGDALRTRLRGPRPGDFGWIVEREAQLAPGGMQFQSERETHAAMVVADYLTAPEPVRNACWIAEQDGVSVGASLVTGLPMSAGTARIAVLFVEPGARRKGIGQQLVEACAAFASESGYERIVCTPDLHLDLAAPLLRRLGFEERRGEAGWEKRLKERGAHVRANPAAASNA
jgi:DNA-binding MarR family transcriptional regulator/GNAT superfamily N-acetyltransferase